MRISWLPWFTPSLDTATEMPARESLVFIPPMMAKLTDKLPEGEQWTYEVKWDGYRGIAVLQDGKARLWSRNERDLGRRFPVLVEALA